MFGRRPRFDDTFGVRMDLGADRMDPMSLRPKSQAGQLRVKAPVIVEQPRSVFDIFSGRDNDPFAAIRERPQSRAKSRPAARAATPRPRAAASPLGEGQQGLRAFEAGLLAMFRRLPVAQRVGLSLFAGWFLLATGLFIPAIVIGVVYFNVRRRVT